MPGDPYHIIDRPKMRAHMGRIRRLMVLAKEVAKDEFGMELTDDDALLLAWKAEDAWDEYYRAQKEIKEAPT